MSALKRTPLRDFHVAHGGRLVDFAGWEMPVQYRGILEEHRAVRTSAGMFDVSHMGEFDVRGPDAARFLNRVITNDVDRMAAGRVLYSPMCQPDGGVVDDLLVYRRGAEDFFLCVNAGNIAKDFSWLGEHASGFDVALDDRSEETALLAVQGPAAARLVQSVTGAKLGMLKYYHFCEATVAGAACIVSRTGYTGEDGFELYHAAGDSVSLAESLLEAGRPSGLELAGLGARDSLRLEAGFPLYGHEISPEISPIAAGLGWTVKWDKGGDFVGRDALLAEKTQGSARRVIHFRTGDRRIVRAGTSIQDGTGAPVGRVLSGTFSPMLNECIGSALVSASFSTLRVDIRGAMIDLTAAKPPFAGTKKTS